MPRRDPLTGCCSQVRVLDSFLRPTSSCASSAAAPRVLLLTFGIAGYVLTALTFTDLDAVEVSAEAPWSCPEPLRRQGDGNAGPGLTLLQGNLWMLPGRPLLLPYDFSTDRELRLERLVLLVRTCEPAVVALQEVFDVSVLEALTEALPGYRAHASGITEAIGSVNRSGLVTLTRVPAHPRAFRGFRGLPGDAKLIERLGKKGFLVTDVSVPGHHVTIVNTHLYASRDSTEAGIAMAQLEEILDFVAAERTDGRTVLLAGDFNLERPDLSALTGDGWTLSSHGPTYDPALNPYTVQGANDTAGNHRLRATGSGRRTIDFAAARLAPDEWLASEVLGQPLLSDHQFLAHALRRHPAREAGQ